MGLELVFVGKVHLRAMGVRYNHIAAICPELRSDELLANSKRRAVSTVILGVKSVNFRKVGYETCPIGH